MNSVLADKRIIIVVTQHSLWYIFWRTINYQLLTINYCYSMMTYYQICSRILNAREKDKNFEKLFVVKDSSSNESAGQLFVDTAVYTRNRCFRLLLSSKAGKSSILLPTERFKCKNLVWHFSYLTLVFQIIQSK